MWATAYDVSSYCNVEHQRQYPLLVVEVTVVHRASSIRPERKGKRRPVAEGAVTPTFHINGGCIYGGGASAVTFSKTEIFPLKNIFRKKPFRNAQTNLVRFF